MPSKYDPYWLDQLREIRAGLKLAAAGTPANLDVRELRHLGARQSWYGAVEVRGRAAGRASMAHAVSLGRIVASSGVCAAWPELTFRFTVNEAGFLSIATARGAGPASDTGLAGIRRAAGSAIREDAAAAVGDGGHLLAEAGCARIHAALRALPAFPDPASVPFRNGLYFFYEQGERSPHAPDGRIVRIGNHPHAQDRLVGRLKDHFNGGPGAKNSSVFRRYLGGAVLRRNDPGGACLQPGPGQGHWEKQGGRPCPSCAETEFAVSDLLASVFTFRCVRVEDRTERNDLEKWLIATVGACSVCRPSHGWLGLDAYPHQVQGSGLWNVQHVGGQLAAEPQARRFEELADMTLATTEPRPSPDLSDTLLVIPCSGGKKDVPDPGLPTVFAGDLLGSAERDLLDQGRQLAFTRPGTALDLASAPRPALARYTGQPYATGGVRDSLIAAIRQGLHCLIISAGYGVLRAEEPIHRYNAQMSQTRPVWAGRMPAILASYVRRQHIERSFVLLSRQYAGCIPPLTPAERRSVPRFTRGRDQGAAIRVVPARIGAELADLLPALTSGITQAGQHA